jgi:hypothetical protein
MSRYFNTDSLIPKLLIDQEKWLGWKKGETDSRGKFPKYPVDPKHTFKISFQDRNNLMSFNYALTSFKSNTLLSGLGYKLDPEAIYEGKYLVGVDIDLCEGRGKEEFDLFRSELNGTYSETSPSGKGIRLFGLTKDLCSNWSHNHIEVYLQNRWLTITGMNQCGEIVDITDALKKFNDKYSGSKPYKNKKTIDVILIPPTPDDIANIKYLLSLINADCSGIDYRNIIFSLLSLSWGQLGIDIAEDWSRTALDRWNEDYFQDLVNRYDENREILIDEHSNTKITVGTLLHHAGEAFAKGDFL